MVISLLELLEIHDKGDLGMKQRTKYHKMRSEVIGVALKTSWEREIVKDWSVQAGQRGPFGAFRGQCGFHRWRSTLVSVGEEQGLADSEAGVGW